VSYGISEVLSAVCRHDFVRKNIQRACQLLRTYNIGYIIAAEEGKLSGILTDRDIAPMWGSFGPGEPLPRLRHSGEIVEKLPNDITDVGGVSIGPAMLMEHEHSPEAIRARLATEPRHTYLRDWVYGGIDGAVTTFAVVSGVIGAELAPGIVLILGVANLIADGFSMAASNYAGTRTERDELRY
jgi:VIT family